VSEYGNLNVLYTYIRKAVSHETEMVVRGIQFVEIFKIELFFVEDLYETGT